jgi:hypothetical protein
MYLANKGHIYLYAAHKVSKRTPVTKALRKDWNTGMRLVILLPQRVQAVDVCNNDIHRVLLYLILKRKYSENYFFMPSFTNTFLLFIHGKYK